MALWAEFDIPFLAESRLEDINLTDMTSIIMQGIESEGKPYLVMRILYEGEHRLGFIIQKFSDRNDEWDYGVLEQLDTHVLTEEQWKYMNNQYSLTRLINIINEFTPFNI
jgi:hypothetical protein